MKLNRVARVALVVAATAALSIPGVAVAGGTSRVAPPPPVVDWQTHLAHMQAMSGSLGAHVVEDCIAIHGSMAGRLGPDTTSFEMIGELVR